MSHKPHQSQNVTLRRPACNPADYLRGVDPGLGPSVEALPATVQLHALIAGELGEPQEPFGYQRPSLVITGTGRRFLARLAGGPD
jgi:hypothetical protein